MTPGGYPGPAGPSFQPSRRRRPWIWLGIGGGSVVVVIIVLIALLTARQPASPARPASRPSASAPSASAPSAATSLPSSALGPSACLTPGRPTAGNGPWKLITPPALCGLPLDNSAQSQQLGQTEASEYETLLSLYNAGSATSTITLEYQSPRIPNFGRSINVVGLEGRFQPAAAVSAIQPTEYSPANVPPGPHGGSMSCEDQEGTEFCVWATSTTVCTIQILDSTGELLGANIAANAVRIRDALEAPA